MLGCVYAAGADGFVPDKETTRMQAAGLFGCADTGANKINGLDLFEDGHGVCLSDGNGMSTPVNTAFKDQNIDFCLFEDVVTALMVSKPHRT